MADVYVNALTQISDEPTTTDSLVVVNRNTNEGKIIDYNKLADVILNKIASKQFSGLNTTSKLLVGAINELDSDVSSLSGMLDGKVLRAAGNTSYTVTMRGNYTPALLFGILQSQKFVALITPGAGNPTVDYVYRSTDSLTISVTSLAKNSFIINAVNSANDFYVLGCDNLT